MKHETGAKRHEKKDVRQETLKHETGDRKHEKGDTRPETGDRRQET